MEVAMVNEIIYGAQSVSPAILQEVLQDERLRWVYAERVEDTVLTWRDALLDETVPLERWHHGRAFGPDLEIGWWQWDEGYEVRAIVAAGRPPVSIAWAIVDAADWQEGDDQIILLIGEHDADRPTDVPTWSVARIPRYLAYPVKVGTAPPQRVALVQRVYRLNGIVVTERLVRLKEVPHA